jgi:multicomponent Na+:H+ antiporter subunit D
MNHVIAWCFLVPMAGGAVAFFLGRSGRRMVGLVTTILTAGTVAGLTMLVDSEGPQAYPVGGWVAPLGITLRCDGMSLLMLILTAVLGTFTSVYSLAYFVGTDHDAERCGLFWPLWLFLWGGMNCLFLSGDLFNLYLLLEFTLLAAVGLASLSGSRRALAASLRYLLAATAAALFYLLGVTFLYSEYSTLDLHGLTAAAPSGFLPLLALGLMLGGLALKCALFPLHFWLPPAHATAPAPVSAVLSALVVKAGFYVIARLWFEVYAEVAPSWMGQLLALLGAAAVLWGSWAALQQERLKMLIAYSTVAQIGYLFLLFPSHTSADQEVLPALFYQVSSHGLAKAAMFLAAGALAQPLHSDLLTSTRGGFRRTPFAVLAILLSGATLAGLAPGGGAKGKMIGLALDEGQWWWAIVVGAGMVLAAAYTWIAVRPSFQKREGSGQAATGSKRILELLALLLACVAWGLSLVPDKLIHLVEIRD